MKRKTILSLVIIALLSVCATDLSVSAEQTVYTTQSGQRYHTTSSCVGLNNARKIYTTTLSKAKAKGLTPCNICANGHNISDPFPDLNSSTPNNNSASGSLSDSSANNAAVPPVTAKQISPKTGWYYATWVEIFNPLNIFTFSNNGNCVWLGATYTGRYYPINDKDIGYEGVCGNNKLVIVIEPAGTGWCNLLVSLTVINPDGTSATTPLTKYYMQIVQ